MAQPVGQAEQDKKKYNHLENVLGTINKNYISLPIEEKKRNAVILEQVLDQFIELMKNNVLFKNLYERKFYGGSYYDQLKVGKPEEYDLDIVLNLPALLEAEICTSEKPGFVHVKINKFDKLVKSELEYNKFPKIETLMDQNTCLSVDKVLAWTDKVISNAMNNRENNTFDVKLNEEEILKLKAIIKKCFPAFTLKLEGNYLGEEIRFDVDLVPCFQFTNKNWPSIEANYRANPFPNERGKFLVVPKKPRDPQLKNSEYYWRLSFQEQERDLLKSSEFRVMKSAIRLLKLLRDSQKHVKIASYFIKTIFLWESQKKPPEFWNQTLSYVFIEMLKIYGEYLKTHSIPYYWNDNYNLLENLKESTVTDISNRIKSIIGEIERNLDDPFVVANKLLPPDKCEAFKSEVPLSKKLTKKYQNSSQNNGCECDCCASKIKNLESRVDVLENENKKVLALAEALIEKLSKVEERLENLKIEMGEEVTEKWSVAQ